MAHCKEKRVFISLVVFVVFLLCVVLSVYRISAPAKDAGKSDGELTSSQATNEASERQRFTSLEGTTGKLFTGEAVRKYLGSRLKGGSVVGDSARKSDPSCERWAVLTTIREPSEAVHRQVKLHNWCLVIVSDAKTPSEYDTKWIEGEGNSHVIILTTNMQKGLASPFVNAIPWGHFGRKNIGYLYAINHGASVIWDFDDDNMLKFWIRDAAPDKAPSLDAEFELIAGKDTSVIHVLQPKGHDWPTYNPYPALGSPILPSWPRGLPLADIKKDQCSNTTIEATKLPAKSIAVLQSLAEGQPDVDAIYRITTSMPRPFAFKRTDETRPLMIPAGVLSPYNAQATLHSRAAFWALLLPITVHGRVSDIWRSYFAQKLFWESNLRIGFAARPLVVHDRTEHDNLGDLDAERDLYMKSKHLVNFLGSWKGKTTTLVERIEELWIALYERQYIELKDVELVQLWLQSLLEAGYVFPQLKRKSTHVPIYPQHIVKRDSSKDEEKCKASRTSLTFLTIDLHDGTRMDMPSVLANLGHKVILAGPKGTYMPHPVIDQEEGISVYETLSDTVKKYTSDLTQLTEVMVETNFQFYKNDSHISSVDAFICSSPASICELWMPFNKTIIFVPAHRYNLGRCTKEEYNRLNEHLYSLASSNNPYNVIAALSRYDEEYLRHYTGLSVAPLYSYSGFYTSENPYKPTRSEIIAVTHKWDNRFKTEIKEFNVVDVYTLYKKYELSDLVSHRAIVYIAYSVMSYKLTEFYSLSIPLFMPSMKFYRNIRNFGADRSSLSKYHCKAPQLDDHMKPHPSSIHPYSPNVEGSKDWEAEYYWLQFSDFFSWPHITYFDDFKDLEQKLQQADFNRIHQLMVVEVERKKEALLNTWCKVAKRIQKMRNVPTDYKKALRELYNVTRILVV